MCLAIPARVVEIQDNSPLRMGKVELAGVSKEVSLGYVPEAGIGDFVLIHAGFAIGVVDEAEADETLRLLAELDVAAAN